MDIEHNALAEQLEREVQICLARKREAQDRQPLTWIVADLEFLYDRERFAAFDALHRNEEKRGIRWPFQQLAAISWLSFRFLPGHDAPKIDTPVVLSAEESSQEDMLSSFFTALRTAGASRLVTWGGEARDYAVLRHLACRYGLVLPEHLRNSSPHAPERLDLCRDVTVQAQPVRLQEYAGGTGVPAKPSQPDLVGHLAELGEWEQVRDHVLADVATTTILTLRHLAASALVACDREKSAMAIADAVGAAFPSSAFWRRDLHPWARDSLRAAGLRGTVYRAPQPA